MRFLKLWFKVVLLAGILLSGRAALAAPVTCSYGYQDSTCGTNLYNAPQVAPTCPGTAGWTTAAAAQWIGSRYTAPQCNYTPPPTCPSGFNQTSAPLWNGSGWVGLGCAVPPPAVPSMPQLAATCEAAIGAMMAQAGFNGSNGYYRGQWGAMSGPVAVGGANPFPPQFASGGFVLVGGGSAGAGDFYWANDLGNPPAGGATGGNGIGMCWFQSGTGNLIGYGYAYDQGNDGG